MAHAVASPRDAAAASIHDRAGRAAGRQRALRVAAILFALAVLVHNGDHLRRGGDSVASDVFWLGTAAIVLEIGVVVMVLRRSPSAPLAAFAVGVSLALGYLFVHFTPERSWLSTCLTTPAELHTTREPNTRA